MLACYYEFNVGMGRKLLHNNDLLDSPQSRQACFQNELFKIKTFFLEENPETIE